ncbi:unnamed protein product [Urochloa humidicola]
MDEYMDALNDASVCISGEALLDEAQSVGHADSTMSTSVAPPPVPRKVPAARNKLFLMKHKVLTKSVKKKATCSYVLWTKLPVG